MGPWQVMARGYRNGRISGLLPHIRARAREYFPGADEIDAVRILAASHRPYSHVYRLAIVDRQMTQREVVVKVCAGAETQYRGLGLVWPHFAAHATWRVPRPLDYFPEPSALVMEAVGGRPLLGELPRLSWSARRLRPAELSCRMAGGWLGFYHGVGSKGESAGLDVAEKLQDFDESLAELGRAGADPRLCRRMATSLGILAARLAPKELPVSYVHGEFTVDNVLIAGSRVTALDLWACTRNSGYHDIASFLNSLLLLRLTRPIPVSALARLRRAFLDGYFGPEDRDERTILFLQGLGLPDVALEIIRRRPSSLVRAWVTRTIAGAMDELTKTTEGPR